MIRPLALIAALTLAACGADGPPVAPSKAAATSGITLSGQASVGIKVSQ
jgi:predicted small lipoprotein YifL